MAQWNIALPLQFVVKDEYLMGLFHSGVSGLIKQFGKEKDGIRSDLEERLVKPYVQSLDKLRDENGLIQPGWFAFRFGATLDLNESDHWKDVSAFVTRLK